MRSRLIQRATVASCLAVVGAAIGCGGGVGGETTGTGHGGTDGETTTGPSVTPPVTPPVAPPAAAVSSCAVARDVVVSDDEGSSPAIAFGGGRYAIAWSDLAHDGGDIVLTVVDLAGNKVREQPIAAGAGAAVSPAVTALPGGGYLVAWQELVGTGGTVRALRVGADGAPMGPAFTVATAGSHEAHPDVATTANGTLITWTEGQGAVIAAVKDDSIGSRLPIPGAAQAAIAPGAGVSGTVWTSGPQIGFAPLGALGSANAAPHAVSFRSAPGRANIPRLAARPGGGFVVVWEDTRGGDDNEAVFLTTLDANGRSSGELQVSPAEGSADYPDVAMIGDRAAVTYYQWRDGPSAIYLSLIDPARGKVGQDLEISGKGSSRYPRLAWGGAGNLAVAYARTEGPVHLAIVGCQ